MNIIRFEPGDGTSYYVIYYKLSVGEQREIGGGADMLFGFGAHSDQPYRCFPFLSRGGGGVGYMDFSYYAEKMGNQSLFTVTVGLVVFGKLTGREIGGFPRRRPYYDDVIASWRSDWEAQLAPLREGASV